MQAQELKLCLPAEVSREQLIHHTAHSLSYSPNYVLSSWVAYKVSKAHVNKDDKMSGKYVPDPKINSRSAKKKDYKQGGYVLGQLVSYIDVKHSPEAVKESFYMSNIIPVKLAFYNHIWLKLEDLIRLWTIDTDELYVVCGPILADSPFSTMGDNKVSVPKRYFKVVYDKKNNRAIGFIVKNGMASGSLKQYAVSVDEVEKETGLDLFHQVEDELENTIEAQLIYDDWDFEVLD